MKKLLFTPTTDTITVCIPPEWVGKPIVCTLRQDIDHAAIVVAVDEPNKEYKKQELDRLNARYRKE